MTYFGMTSSRLKAEQRSVISDQFCDHVARVAMQRQGRDVADHVGQLRIFLSGTPVEKKLRDLQSQLEWILPGSLTNSGAEFQRNFVMATLHTQCALRLSQS